jgi:hypothetical protein
MLGGCLGFGAASFAPLWELKRTKKDLIFFEPNRTIHFADSGRGSFWGLLGELPSAADSGAAADDVETVLAPERARTRGWRNLRTTLLVLAAGAALGFGVWALRFVPPLTPPGE